MRILLVLTLIFILSCRGSKQYSSEQARIDLGLEEGREVTCKPNQSGTYDLCTSGEVNKVESALVFLIYNKSEQKVVFDASVVAGYVKWISDIEVEYYSAPGIVSTAQSKEDFIWIYNTQTGETIRKSASNQKLK